MDVHLLSMYAREELLGTVYTDTKMGDGTMMVLKSDIGILPWAIPFQ